MDEQSPPSLHLVVVSNRLPFQLHRQALSSDPEQMEWRRSKSAGGLVTAIKPLLVQSHGVWVGWPGVPTEKQEELRIPDDPEDTIRGEQIVAVNLTAEETDDFYNGMCNATLWPLLHSMLNVMSSDNKQWRVYQKVNERFANHTLDVVLSQREKNMRSFVWVHDYHLLLMAKMLRDKFFTKTNMGLDEEQNLVAFFLHVPFPAYGVLQHFDAHQLLLEGMLGNDIVGFQDDASAQNFALCCREALGLQLFFENETNRSDVVVKTKEGRRVTVRALPIGIPFDRFHRMVDLATEQAITQAAVENIVRKRQNDSNFQLMVGVDRLDYTKGIPNRLLAFELLLEEYPQLIGRVTLLQVAVPSRTSVKAYQDERELIHEIVQRIHLKFDPRHKHTSYSPIVYVEEPLSQRTLAAVYNLADVAVVTSLKDGMNLVAMEYVACQRPENKESCGVLVLSSETGAAKHLDEAIVVNPHNIANITEGMLAALAMQDEDRAERMQKLRNRVRSMDVSAWMNQFVRLVESKADLMQIEQTKMQEHKTKIAEFIDKREKLLLLLDFDGTLCPMELTPEQAHLSGRMRNTLDRLMRLAPAVTLAAVSGRAVDDIEAKITNRPRLGSRQSSSVESNYNGNNNGEEADYSQWIISGDHGEIIRYPDGSVYEPTLDEESVTKLGNELDEKIGTKFVGVIIERKRFSVCVHVRNVVGGDEVKEETLREAEALAKELGFLTQRGHSTVECKARGSGSKGTATLHILETCFGPDWQSDSSLGVLYFGDDTTDEDAMRVLKSADNTLSFRVVASEDASLETSADVRLTAMLEVQVILDFISDHLLNSGKMVDASRS